MGVLSVARVPFRVEPERREGDADLALVERARGGDRGGFDGLVRRYQGPILHLAARRLGDDEEAKDVAQRAFARAFVQLDRFRGESSFKTWLYRIALNLATDALRGRGRALRLERAAAEAPEAPSTLEPEDRRRLRAAIAKLPDMQRLAVELRAFDELAFREVGEVIGCSEDAAKMNYQHGLKRLRALLGEGPDHG
jgi:RNA polymerase sigma-70 factor (ECF subfamily)